MPTTVKRTAKVVVPQEKIYKLTQNRTPRTSRMKSGSDGKLTALNSKGLPRKIRYCANESSIYVDEQSDNAAPEMPLFTNGYLRTSSLILQTFLETSPQFNKEYELVDMAADARERMNKEDLITDLRAALKEMAGEKNAEIKMQPIAAVILGDSATVRHMEIVELREIIQNEINKNPYRFLDENDQPDLNKVDDQARWIGLSAIEKNIIRLSADQNKYVWTLNGNVIINLPKGVKAIDYLTEFLQTDEGTLVAKEIVEAIKKVNAPK